MNISTPIQQFLKQNATSILTGISIAGTGVTAVLAGRASVKAVDIIRDAEGENGGVDFEATTSDKIKLVWPLFVPAAISATVTVVSIVMINRISAREAAALAAVAKLNEDKLKQYRAKVEEKLGLETAQDISNEITEQRMDDTSNNEVLLNNTNSLFYDEMTGRYFYSTLLKVHQAENTVNRHIMMHGIGSLGLYYSEIGVSQPDISEDLGWNADMLVEVNITTRESADQRPAFVLSFVSKPLPNYGIVVD